MASSVLTDVNVLQKSHIVVTLGGVRSVKELARVVASLSGSVSKSVTRVAAADFWLGSSQGSLWMSTAM